MILDGLEDALVPNSFLALLTPCLGVLPAALQRLTRNKTRCLSLNTLRRFLRKEACWLNRALCLIKAGEQIFWADQSAWFIMVDPTPVWYGFMMASPGPSLFL